LDQGNFQLIEEAQGASKITANYSQHVLTGLVGGLMVAIALVILLDYLKHTIKSPKDIVQELGLTPLGTIPNLGSKKKLINPDPQIAMGGSFAFIRDSLKNTHPGKSNRSILITSTDKGEGKTFVASNLSMTYALEEDSVVLLQANLRDSLDISDLKPLRTDEETPGIWEYLEGEADIQDIVKETEVENLHVILPGKSGKSNPVKLLRSDPMAELIKYLESKYGLVVIYTAEVSKYSDAAVLSSLTDGILLVIEYGRVNATEIKQAVNRMKGPGASILGAVINKRRDFSQEIKWKRG
jgi:receptor protein-tyrosine kinase